MGANLNNKQVLAALLDKYSYDATSGIFTHKKNKLVGNKNKSGYLSIALRGRCYYVHRLVWLVENGDFPKNEIDHIDGNKHNNRIANLRDAPHRENCQNLRCHREGLLPGAQWDPVRKRYRARLRIKGKRIRLGNYITAQEAHEVYMRACAKYGVTA